ncbi:MAG: hypothetical protein HFG73_10620 [Hungatella sp.]|nr:hypothetical protein [Hungatella sp.]
MVAYKHITKIISVIVAAAVLVCVLALLFPERVAEAFGEGVVALQYETELFDTSRIMEIDIRMDEDEWADMLANALEENYYSCDVVINGETIYHAGIRPKGNTSLTSVAADPDTDRFSFKIEFDRYVDGQTCFGLDKLVLNNNYADATNMKEALVYDMYRYLGADASLYNYAEISVNGRYWGVYLALEAVEDSFQLRNYKTADGNLYKPEGMGMGGGRDGEKGGFGQGGEDSGWMGPGGAGEPGQPGERAGEDGKAAAWMPPDNPEAMQDNGEKPDETNEKEASGGEQTPGPGGRPEWGDMPGRGPLMGGGGANLNYTDDDLDSYTTIWEGEVSSTGKKDHRRVVTALKNISQGNDLERYMDVDNLLKYMAVHVFSVNLDSLSGMMAHNYYLYEDSGRLNILPWDYNLSFGGMGMGQGNSASETVNDAIDTPFEGTEFFDGLLEDEAYLARYHEYLRQLAQEYVCQGGFEEFYNRVRSQIDPLVDRDPTAFYSMEEYNAGAGMLYETVMLRAESIRGQLDGSIPSTDQGQKEDSSSLIDGAGIDIDVMGTMGRNRSFGRGEAGEEAEQRTDHPADKTTQQRTNPESGKKAGQTEEDRAREAFIEEDAIEEGGRGFWGDMEAETTPGMQGKGPLGRGLMPGAPGVGNGEMKLQNLIVCGICLLAAILALAMAALYRRIPGRN